MTFEPHITALAEYKSFAIDEFKEMGRTRLRGSTGNLSAHDMALLSQLRGAIRLLNKIGAIRPEWFQEQDEKAAQKLRSSGRGRS